MLHSKDLKPSYLKTSLVDPSIIDDAAISDAIRRKCRMLRDKGVKVKYNLGRMTSKEKVGFNGRLDRMLDDSP